LEDENVTPTSEAVDVRSAVILKVSPTFIVAVGGLKSKAQVDEIVGVGRVAIVGVGVGSDVAETVIVAVFEHSDPTDAVIVTVPGVSVDAVDKYGERSS
jgi:hypothetical protein